MATCQIPVNAIAITNTGILQNIIRYPKGLKFDNSVLILF